MTATENPLGTDSPILLCETSVTLMPKTRERHYKKRKLQTNIFQKHKNKNPFKNSKLNPKIYKHDNTS